MLANRGPNTECENQQISDAPPQIRQQPAAASRRFRFPVPRDRQLQSMQIELLQGQLLASAHGVDVYLDHQVSESVRLRNLAQQITTLAGTELLPMLRRRLSGIQDLDHSGGMTVLLTPQLTALDFGRSAATVPLKGLTWGEDFDANSPVGNQADLIYLHSEVAPDAGLRSLLQHELTHAIFFSQSVHGSRSPPLEDWLSEGIAHLVETWNNSDSSNWEQRVRSYREATWRFPLIVSNYSASGMWRNPGCRGGAMEFFYWCEQRHGPDFARRILLSTGTGLERIEAGAGAEFPVLFRHFGCATLMSPAQLPRLPEATVRHSEIEFDISRAAPLAVPLYGTSFRTIRIPPIANQDSAAVLEVRGPDASSWQVTLISESSLTMR